MEIIMYPDARLKVICKSVEKVTPELAAIAKEMFETMIQAQGIGLSANQVGLDIRLVVLRNNGLPLYMFNPKIIQASKDKHIDNESCLSFGPMIKKIPRAYEVVVKYRDINNARQHIKLTGLMARCIMHEINHLDGILLSDLEEKT
jgi:peptide deformylase